MCDPTNRFTSDVTVLDQYKVYVDDLGKIGNRHSDASKFFITLLSALLAFQSLTTTSGKLTWIVVVFNAAVPAAGSILCILWIQTTRSYAKLYGAKLIVIRTLETKLSYPCYDEEWNQLKRLGYKPIGGYEQKVSWTLLAVFVVLFVLRLAATGILEPGNSS